MMHPKATTKDQAEASTWVIWGIKSCHFPAECDASRVGPCIRRALKILDYNGPVTITAIGVLTKVPDDIMQSVSSTGVVLCHTPTTGIRAAMLLMDQEHPPPANILLISAKNYSRLLCYLEKEQFNVLPQVFHDYSPIATAATSAQVESLWKSFLQEEEKCSETSECDWICKVCEVDEYLDFTACEGFDNFINHLLSQEHHEQHMLDIMSPVKHESYEEKAKAYRDSYSKNATK